MFTSVSIPWGYTQQVTHHRIMNQGWLVHCIPRSTQSHRDNKSTFMAWIQTTLFSAAHIYLIKSSCLHSFKQENIFLFPDFIILLGTSACALGKCSATESLPLFLVLSCARHFGRHTCKHTFVSQVSSTFTFFVICTGVPG